MDELEMTSNGEASADAELTDDLGAIDSSGTTDELEAADEPGDIPDYLVEGPLSFAWPHKPARNISHIPLFNGIGTVFNTTEPPYPTYVIDKEQDSEDKIYVEHDDDVLVFSDETDHNDTSGIDSESEITLADFFHQIRLFLLVVIAELVFWAMVPGH